MIDSDDTPSAETGSTDLVLVVVARTDLGMSVGKMAAQVSHAAVELVLDSTDADAVSYWRRGGQPKVVLAARTREQLAGIGRDGRARGLPIVEVVDSGRTEVAAATLTAIGIGPCPRGSLREITGHLELLS